MQNLELPKWLKLENYHHLWLHKSRRERIDCWRVVVEMFNCMTGIAKYFEIVLRVIRAVSVSMMNQQFSFGITSVAGVKFDEFSIVLAHPRCFAFPVAISSFSYLLRLKLVAAFKRASDCRLNKQLEANNAWTQGTPSFPARIVFSQLRLTKLTKLFGLTSSIFDSHTVTGTKSASTSNDSRRELIKYGAAFLTSASNLRHECIISCMG